MSAMVYISNIGSLKLPVGWRGAVGSVSKSWSLDTY